MLIFNELKDLKKEALNLEDLFTIVYCIIDDYYKLLIGSPRNIRNSNNWNPHFTDAELITIALVGELKGETSENGWWQFVSKNYRYLFPQLCGRTRYGRRVRNLRGVMEIIRKQFLYQLDVNLDRYRLVDTFPLRLLKLQRFSSSSCPFEYAASIGYCSSFKETYYGFKVNILTDLREIPIAFVLTPAFPHDSRTFLQFLEELGELGFTDITVIIVGDKAYVGEEYVKHIKEKYGIQLLPIEKHYDKNNPITAINQLLTKSRKMIETTISSLTRIMNANQTLCRSIQGLVTRMLTKIMAFNLGNLINSFMGEPLLEISNFVK